MKDKIKYLTDRYDELMWQAQHVEPLRELDIWGQRYSQTWGHHRNSYRGEDGAPFERPDIAAVVHFNQWRPEYVLAHIAAMRAVLTLHEPQLATDVWGREIGGYGCSICDVEPDLQLGGIEIEATNGCKTIRALLQPFADRKDFPREWRA